jgi:mRNA interferase HicA
MKRTELIRKLEEAGCVLIRHGGKHDWYRNQKSGVSQPVPRHRDQRIPGNAHSEETSGLRLMLLDPASRDKIQLCTVRKRNLSLCGTPGMAARNGSETAIAAVELGDCIRQIAGAELGPHA